MSDDGKMHEGCHCRWSPLYGHATACPLWQRPPSRLRGLFPDPARKGDAK